MRKFVLALAGLCLPAAALAASQQPIEPIEIPPSVEQGLDMVYIDREIAPSIEKHDAQLEQQGYGDFQSADMDMFAPVHPLYTELRRSLVRYRMRWGDLPQVQIPAGPVLKLNTTGDRLQAAMQTLDARARDILVSRWTGDAKATLHELADKYGVSAERVRQIEANAIKKLRGLMSGT